MQYTVIALATLLATAQAGNLCLAGTYKPSKIDTHKLYAFAAATLVKTARNSSTTSM